MAYIGRENDGFGVRSRFIYTATGGQTTFNTDDSGNALSYSDGAYVDVYLNGVLLDPADYTDTSLTSIVLGSGATASDILEVIVYDVFSVFSGTFTTGITAGDATITGDLTVDTDTLFVDASADKVAMGTTSADADASVLTIKGTDPAQIYDGQIIIHGSATSGAANTGAGIGFKGHNGSGNRNLGAIQSLKENGTSGNADAYMRFVTRSNSGGLAERMRIASDGTLLIAQTADDSGVAGHIFNTNGSVFHVRDGGLPFVINRLTDDGAVAGFRKDGATVGQINVKSGDMAIGTGDTGVRFNDNLNAIQPFNASTNAAINNTVDLGSSAATFNEAYIQGGVYIGGTGSVNLLDDYEEGTFTPTYIGSSSNPTVTYDRQYGHYVKIGRQVIANIGIRTDAFSGGSGNMYVSGLPFTPVAPTGTIRAGTGHIGYSSAFNDKGPQTAYLNGGNNAIILLRSADTDSWGENDTAMASSNFLDGSNKNFLMITAIYTA